MIDHVTVRVKNYSASKHFYEKALTPIGYKLLAEFEIEGGHVAGFGKERPDFWITTDKPTSSFVHVAFGVEDRNLIHSFYDAALGAGGKNNGKPGPRTLYHPNYFGAFVLDPDGNNIEVMCRKPA